VRNLVTFHTAHKLVILSRTPPGPSGSSAERSR
jgi:uncharacterized protein YbgA (DUF1722 family)